MLPVTPPLVALRTQRHCQDTYIGCEPKSGPNSLWGLRGAAVTDNGGGILMNSIRGQIPLGDSFGHKVSTWMPTVMFVSAADAQRRSRPDLDTTNQKYSSTWRTTFPMTTFSSNPGDRSRPRVLPRNLANSLPHARHTFGIEEDFPQTARNVSCVYHVTYSI
jgi:hypothetical protein